MFLSNFSIEFVFDFNVQFVKIAMVLLQAMITIQSTKLRQYNDMITLYITNTQVGGREDPTTDCSAVTVHLP